MTDCLTSNLEREGERREFAAHGHAMLGNAGGMAALRSSFEPGWRWSNDVAPLMKTERCPIHHLGLVVSGSIRIQLADGTECDVGPGDLFDAQPGHDAWTTSDEPCVIVDVSPEATRYAVGRPADLRAPDDGSMTLVRRGFTAFNNGDMDTLRSILSHDVTQHVPGQGRFAGAHKGIDAVLEYYGKLFEISGGTMRADLIDVHGDGAAHVVAYYQTSATLDGRKRVTRDSILFTFVGDKATDLLELRGDLPGDDAFFG